MGAARSPVCYDSCMDDRLEPGRLHERVRVLFGVEPLQEASAPREADPAYSFAENIEAFKVSVPRAYVDPQDMTDAWLSTPNATFGGRCPQEFLDGDQDQRAFLESILSSLEDGAFS